MTKEIKKLCVTSLLGAVLLALVGCGGMHPPYYDPYVSSSYASYPYPHPVHHHGASGQYVGGGQYGDCLEDVEDPCFTCGDSYSNDFECGSCDTGCGDHMSQAYQRQPQYGYNTQAPYGHYAHGVNPHPQYPGGQPYCDPTARMQRSRPSYTNDVRATVYSNPHTTEGHFWGRHFGEE